MVPGDRILALDQELSLDRENIKLRDLAITRPTLDDVFLTLTGKEIPVEEDAAGNGGRTARSRT